MKVQKTLTNLSEKYNLKIETITYRVAWCNAKIKRKGYDLIKQDGERFVKIEPVFYNNRDKWLINFTDHSEIYYIKSLRELPALIDKLFEPDLKPIFRYIKTAVCY